MPYHVTIRLTAADNPDRLEASIDQIMEELVRLAKVDPCISDPSIGAELATGEVEFTLTVDAAEQDFVKVAVTTIRAAIHAAGEATPGWPTFEPAQEVSAERVATPT